MKNIKLLLFSCLFFFHSCYTLHSQENAIDKTKLVEDIEEIITDLSNNYIYLDEKEIDLKCIHKYYINQIDNITTKEEAVLFFEFLLDEFYDSHLILNTNVNSSFRLYSPIYSEYINGKTIIKHVWLSQIEEIEHQIIGAEIQKINGIDFQEAIDNFPTHCNNKNSIEVRTWISNKILAGRYNSSRRLTLKIKNKNEIELDLDKMKIKEDKGLLNIKEVDDIGIIRINNSLGNNNLIMAFDDVLDSLFNKKGLILDLRNTVDGGNSYVARAIMGRFIKESKPYQKHWTIEKYEDYPAIERTWVEYVSPRLKTYEKPLIILVGRWTGSMGEGLAIGFEGMGRAKIIGTEMERLAGAIDGFTFKNLDFGYRISTEKLYHINDQPREKYVPTNYVQQTTTKKDETLEKAIEIINREIEDVIFD